MRESRKAIALLAVFIMILTSFSGIWKYGAEALNFEKTHDEDDFPGGSFERTYMEEGNVSLNWTTRTESYENDNRTLFLNHFDEPYYGEDGEFPEGFDNSYLGFWKFDEGRGKIINDSTGNGNDGLWKGWYEGNWTEGKYGKGLEFDGVDDWIHLQSFSNITMPHGTIELWFKPVIGYTGAGAFFSHGVSGPDDLKVQYSSGKIAFQIGNSSIESDIDTWEERWYFLVVLWDDTEISMYIDGEMQSEINASWGGAGAGIETRIGRHNSPTSNFFRGFIDEVAVYNRAKTFTEIQSSYLNRISRYTGTSLENGKYSNGISIDRNDTIKYPVGLSTDSSCVGLWRFDEPYGQEVLDSSGNFLTGDYLKPLYQEEFSTDVFAGDWMRSDSSVNVDIGNGWLHFDSGGGSGTIAYLDSNFQLPLMFETRMRSVSGTSSMKLPWTQLSSIPSLSYGDNTAGWYFGDWTYIPIPGPIAKGEWWTIRLIIYPEYVYMLVKPDFSNQFSFIIEKGLAITEITQIKLTQTVDDVSDFDYVRIYNLNITRTQGKYGNGADFDGDDDYISIPDNDKLDVELGDSFTIEAWVNATDLDGTADELVSKIGPPGDFSYGLELSDGRPWFRVWTSNTQAYVMAENPIETGKWYLLAGVYNGTELRLYVNGICIQPPSPLTGDINNSITDLRIGAYAFTNLYFFNGTIDEVVIFNRAKSEEEIYKDYLGNFNPEQGTFEMWVKPEWNGNDGMKHELFRYNAEDNNNTITLVKDDDDNIKFRIGNGSSFGQTSIPISLWNKGTWYHIATTWDANIMRMYINGELMDSQNNLYPNTATPSFFYIGGISEFAADAVIDELRISNVPREPEEFREFYRLGEYASPSIDGGEDVIWQNISWEEELSEGDDKLFVDESTVGLWRFNEGYGSMVHDESKYHNDGNWSGWPIGNWTKGKYGGALEFDGVDDYVEVEDDSSLHISNQITFEAWIKPSSLPYWQTMLIKGMGLVAWDYGFGIREGKIGYYCSTGFYAITEDIIQIGVWQYIAVTVDDTTNIIEFYIDGNRYNGAKAVLNGTLTEPLIHQTSYPLTIGNYHVLSGDDLHWFNGFMDEVRISNRLLTSEEIMARYNSKTSKIFLQTRESDDNSTWSEWTGNEPIPQDNEEITPSQPNGTLLQLPFDGSYNGYDQESWARKGECVNVSDPALVGYWKLDSNKGGKAVDYSGNGNDGFVYRARVTEGLVGNAFRFDGENDFVYIPSSISLSITNSITIEAWINPGNITISGSWEDDNLIVYRLGSYQLGISESGQLYCKMNGVNPERIDGPLMTPFIGHWTHVACTYDGSAIRLFLNGKEEGSLICTGNILSIDEWIGIGWRNYNRYFNGLIDEVAIYDRPLTEKEIAAHAHNPYYSREALVTQGKFLSGFEVNENDVLSYPIGSSVDEGTLLNCKFDRNHFGENGEIGNYGYDYNSIPGIVSAWTFEGNADDVIGSNHGTVYSANIKEGYSGQAYEFDGIDDYIEIPDSNELDLTDSLTIEAWIYPRTRGTYGRPDIIVSKWLDIPDSRSYWFSILVDGKLYGVYDTNGDNTGLQSVTSKSLIPVNKWTHVAWTVGNSISKLYINGKLDNSTSVGGSIFVGIADVIIGQYDDVPYNDWFDGIIDEVSIYNRALSEEEIATHYGFRQGKYGQGIYAAGSNHLSYSTDNNLDINKGTIQLWLQHDWEGNNLSKYVIFEEYVPGGESISLYKPQTQPELVFRYGTTELKHVISIWNKNEWHFITASWDQVKGSVELYVDGMLINASSISGYVGNLSSEMFLGCDHNLQNQANATIDEFVILDYARSANDIYQDYLGNFQANEGTVSFWFKPYWNGSDNNEHVLFCVDDGDEDQNNNILFTKTDLNELSLRVINSTGGTFWANFSVSETSLPAYYWEHISFTWNSSEIAIYLNGTMVAYNPFSGTIDHLPSYLFIGSEPSNKTNRANGVIDDLVILNYVRMPHQLIPKGYTNSTGEQINASDSRYIQYRAIINTRDIENSAKLLNVTLFGQLQNSPPLITTSDVTTVIEDVQYSVPYNYTDPDNDTVTWNFDTNATWLFWGASNHTLYGTPGNGDVGQYWVRINISDGKGGLDEHYFLLTVINSQPMILSSDIDFAQEDILYYNDYSCDDDGQGNITWNLTTDADWLSINSSTGNLSGTPLNDDVGIYWVNVTVNDGNGGTDSSNFSLTVANTPPTILTPDIILIQEDTLYYNDYASDDDGQGNIVWSLQTNASWLSIDDVTGVLNGTPLNDDVGSYWVNVTVDDGNGGIDTSSFILTVQNNPPEILTPDIIQAWENILYFNDYSSNDDGQGNIVWMLQTNATWLSIDDVTGNLSGTPGGFDTGQYFVNVTVYDGNGGLDWSYFILTVNNINDDPVITNPIELIIYTDEDVQFSYDFDFFDIDLDNVSWNITTTATWFTGINNNGILSGIPAQADIGVYLVSISCSDGKGGITWNNFTIVVNNTNDPPIITTGNVNDTIEDQEYSVNYDFFDEDGDYVTWHLGTNASWLLMDSESGELHGIPGNSDVGIFWINITLTDGNGGIDSRNFSITVSNMNDPPYFDGIPDEIEVKALQEETMVLMQFIFDIDNSTDDLLLFVDSLYANIDGYDLILLYSDYVYEEEVTILLTDGEFAVEHKLHVTIIPSDTIPPEIVEVTPEGDEISINTAITILFSEEMDHPTTENAFSVLGGISGAFSWDDLILIFIPDNPLSYNTVYFVQIGNSAKDTYGNTMTNIYYWQFTTEPGIDSDNDGIQDVDDPDDDNDGVLDEDDAFPTDPTEWEDTDEDGIGNNDDPDDDDDGILDGLDDFPLDAYEYVDTDNDGTGDNADTDDDGDGALDSEDEFPLDPTEWADFDDDGTGDNKDPDDDNDGRIDTRDYEPFNPKVQDPPETPFPWWLIIIGLIVGFLIGFLLMKMREEEEEIPEEEEAIGAIVEEEEPEPEDFEDIVEKDEKEVTIIEDEEAEPIDEEVAGVGEQVLDERETHEEHLGQDILSVWNDKYESKGYLSTICPSCFEEAEFRVETNEAGKDFICPNCKAKYVYEED